MVISGWKGDELISLVFFAFIFNFQMHLHFLYNLEETSRQSWCKVSPQSQAACRDFPLTCALTAPGLHLVACATDPFAVPQPGVAGSTVH